FRGGVTTAGETLRSGLAELGHDVWVFAPAARAACDDPPGVFRDPSIPAPTYPQFALPPPLSARPGAIPASLDPATLPAPHPFLLGVTARRLARRLHRPLVFTYHTRYEKYAHYVPLPERMVGAMAVRLACRFARTADLVVAPSAHMAATLAARGVDVPIAVVPTGVPLDLFAPGARVAARQRLGLPD